MCFFTHFSCIEYFFVHWFSLLPLLYLWTTVVLFAFSTLVARLGKVLYLAIKHWGISEWKSLNPKYHSPFWCWASTSWIVILLFLVEDYHLRVACLIALPWLVDNHDNYYFFLSALSNFACCLHNFSSNWYQLLFLVVIIYRVYSSEHPSLVLQALDLKPNYVRAWANMGISYANQVITPAWLSTLIVSFGIYEMECVSNRSWSSRIFGWNCHLLSLDQDCYLWQFSMKVVSLERGNR